MADFRKGLIKPQVSSSQPQAPSSAHIPRARVVPQRIAEPAPQPQRSALVMPNQPREPAVRGVLVDTTGRLHRGLSPATVQAYQAHNENATEQCKNCGEFKTLAQMGVVVGNAHNPNNPLRLCDTCRNLAYKDPNNPNATWSPKVPGIRFDREMGIPYDANRARVTVNDLLNRDAYHDEHEVSEEQKRINIPKFGQWSGGGRVGHTHTQTSLDSSRSRADNARRSR